MIKELSELGKILRIQQAQNQCVHDALKPEPLSIELIISKDGSFGRFEVVEKKQTVAEAIVAKKGKARLLLDKAEEVLCYGGDASKKKHGLFLAKLQEYWDLPELIPVLNFYKENKINGLDKALDQFEIEIPDEKNRKGNIGFRIITEGVRVHEKPEVRNKVIAKYESNQEKLLATGRKKCSLCGQTNFPVEDIPHGMIKNVPDGKSSGCALVSYNEKAFESYDLEGNNNSSICTNCAKTYVEGLNWLLADGNPISGKGKKEDVLYSHRWPKKRSQNYLVDTATVYWTRNHNNLPEMDYLEEPNPGDVARLIGSVTSGAEKDNRYIEPDQFYSFTLSGSAARIAVRDWIETSLYDLKRSIAQWFKDIAIEEYDGELKRFKIHYSRLYDLARSCQRKNTDGSFDKDDSSLPRVAGHLWGAALKNMTLPLWILTKVLQRARLDNKGVTAERAALIKVILNRNNKGGDFVITEKMEDGLKPVAYMCGQIFAKFESIQYAALGERNAGIRERYFTYAMTSPAAAFGRLFNLNSKHFTKLKNEKPGLAVNMDKELQALCKNIDINKFPSTFTLEEQGQFAIGYYHQRQSQFSGTNSNENK
jgi:CRISPR-associated protein Csd1